MSATGNRARRKSPPWLVGAIAHHSATRDEAGMGCDWDEAASRCWRCGRQSILQRCHIVPKAMGGSEDPSNMVALCSRCHDEAPDVASSEMMWAWIRSTCATFHGDIWAQRVVDGMRKRDVEYLLAMGKEDADGLKDEAARLVGVHCGQGNQGAYIKTSSWVAALSLAIADHRRRRHPTPGTTITG